MPANSWKLAPGLNNVGSYQVSGKPFISGSCIAPVSGAVSYCLRFPNVTKWFQIELDVATPNTVELKIAFSENGLHGKNGAFFTMRNSSSFQRPLDMKVSELWFQVVKPTSTTATFDVIAGLTNIGAGSTNTATSASINGQWKVNGTTEAGGPNWSGSLGVS